MQELLDTYMIVIGGGGYGVVKTGTDEESNKIAVKFLKAESCPSAKREFIINKKINNAFNIFQTFSNKPYISIVETESYVDDDEGISSLFNCAVVMKRLKSLYPDGYAIHVSVNGQLSSSQMNKLVYSGNAPRGYFYDTKHIIDILDKTNLTLVDVVYRIGILVGVTIFGAYMVPVDAEYILTLDDNDMVQVTMIDYGMFESIDVNPSNYKDVARRISDEQDDNLYYHPATDAIPDEYADLCKVAFIKGFTEAYMCFADINNANYELLYKELIELYATA